VGLKLLEYVLALQVSVFLEREDYEKK
jgi:hypothetical protein